MASVHLDIFLESIRLEVGKHYIGSHCKYMIVLCVGEEDGLEILSNETALNHSILGHRVTLLAPSVASLQPGHLNDVFVYFNQNLFIPLNASPNNEHGDVVLSTPIYLWLFQVSFQRSLELREPVPFGYFDQNDFLPLPRTRASSHLVNNATLPFLRDSRRTFSVSLLGISPLLEGHIHGIASDTSKHINFSSLNELSSRLCCILSHERPKIYSAKSLIRFFNGTPLLPPFLRSAAATLCRSVGEISCKVNLVLPASIPITSGLRYEPKLIWNKVATEKYTTLSPYSGSIMIYFKNLTNVALSDFVKTATAKEIPLSNVFSAIHQSHFLRVFWVSQEDVEYLDILKCKLQTQEEFREGNTSPYTMEGKWIASSRALEFSSIKCLTESSVPCVEFSFDEKVWLFLPYPPRHHLQCIFTIRPSTTRFQNVQLYETVLFKLNNTLEITSAMHGKTIGLPMLKVGDSGPRRSSPLLHLSFCYIPQNEMYWRSNVYTEYSPLTSMRNEFEKLPLNLTFDNLYSLFNCLQRNSFGNRSEVPIFGFNESEVICKQQKDTSQQLFNPICLKTFSRDSVRLDPRSIWIVNGNPASCLVAGKAYIFNLDVNPLHFPQQHWEKEAFREALTVELITQTEFEQGLHSKFFLKVKKDKMNDFLVWKTLKSPYLCTIACRILRKGKYLLGICFAGHHIASSPFSVTCIPGCADPNMVSVEWSSCLASSVPLDEIFGVTSLKEEIITHLNSPLYSNIIHIKLYDSFENSIHLDSNVLAAQSFTEGLEVLSLEDHGNGQYDLSYRITLPPSKVQQTLLSTTDVVYNLSIYLNNQLVLGGPLSLHPENLEEIEMYYRNLFALNYVPHLDILNISKADEIAKAQNSMHLCHNEWGQNLQTALEKIQQLSRKLHSLRESATEALISSKPDNGMKLHYNRLGDYQLCNTHKALSTLKRRCILSHLLRYQLQHLQQSLSLHQKAGTNVESTLSVLQKRTTFQTAKISYEMQQLKHFHENTLNEALKYYESAFKASNERNTKKLMQFLRQMEQKNLNSLEDLLRLEKSIAQELRRLKFIKEAEHIDKISRYTIEELHLKHRKNYLEKKSQVIQEFEGFVKQQEENLEKIKSSFSEKQEKIKEHKEKKVSPEIQLILHSKGVQTQDPLTSLDTQLGPMIAFRATGVSPFINEALDSATLDQMARGTSMSPTLKKFWHSCSPKEILRFKKVIQSCPRIHKALNEIFMFLSGSDNSDHWDLSSEVFHGISWPSYVRFCQELYLSELLINDPTALRSLFLKFSTEFKKCSSSSLAASRRIVKPFWISFLRELGYLNTLSTLIITQKISSHGNLSRLSCFHFFLSENLLPYYSNFLRSAEHRPFTPLLPDTIVNNALSQVSKGKILDTLDSLDEQSMKEKIAAFLNKEQLERIFYKLFHNGNNSFSNRNDSTMSFTGTKQDRNLVSRIFFYLTSIGFCPGYLESSLCLDICKQLFQAEFPVNNDSNTAPLSLYSTMFDHFVDLLLQLLAKAAKEAFKHFNVDSSGAVEHQITLYLNELIKLMEWG